MREGITAFANWNFRLQYNGATTFGSIIFQEIEVSEKDILQAGVSAFQAGDRAKATTLFAQVVKQNPMSEQGWYLLGMSVDSREQREYCLKRVLAINPNNRHARRQLMPHPAPAPSASASPHTESPSQSRKPFTEKSDSTRTSSAPAFEQDKAATSTVEKPRQGDRKKPPARKNQNNNRVLAISLFAVFFIGLCSLGGLFILFRDRLLPAAPVSQPLAQVSTPALPTLLPTATFTLVPPTVLPSPLPTVAYTPEFEEVSCWFDSTRGVDVRCGYVTVPESRSGDPSDTIRLAVAVFKGKKSAQTPVMFLQGGPGGQAVQLSMDAYGVLVEPFLDDRDFITFDQRGTGLSEPALNCEELQKTHKQDIYGGIPAETRRLVYGNSFLSCNGLLLAKGVNLNAYTTMESAADLKDILQLLGYSKVHLYGASYGTRLAQVAMREYPEIVESAVLDSVVPVETNFFKSYPESIQSGLRTLFEACMLDVKCNMAYPSLETVFWDTYNNLNAKPVTLTTSVYPVGTVTETVDGTVFMSTILGSIKSSYFIETAPQTIYRVKEGDFSTLLAAQYSLPYAFDGINPGLYISMMCHEHVLSTTPQDLAATSALPGINSYAWLPFYGDANDIYKSCQSWGSTGPMLGENDAVVSSIPSLVIAGRFDPTTPPIYARQLAEHLPNSYYFEFDNQGHVPSASDDSGCAMDTVLAFLRNPFVEPSRECMSKLKAVDFLTPYVGDPALSLSREDLFGITVDVPKDWHYSQGFFVRGNSAFDVTQVGAFRVDFVSASDLKDFFSSGANGYRGLDNAPMEAGIRNSNGINWTLYVDSSDGHPVDIALADSGNSSLIILMFSHADEHDALYQTVFLPMIDSAK
jgi:pimeloyl-ACP methyl ester carboxylesterase